MKEQILSAIPALGLLVALVYLFTVPMRTADRRTVDIAAECDVGSEHRDGLSNADTDAVGDDSRQSVCGFHALFDMLLNCCI